MKMKVMTPRVKVVKFIRFDQSSPEKLIIENEPKQKITISPKVPKHKFEGRKKSDKKAGLKKRVKNYRHFASQMSDSLIPLTINQKVERQVELDKNRSKVSNNPFSIIKNKQSTTENLKLKVNSNRYPKANPSCFISKTWLRRSTGPQSTFSENDLKLSYLSVTNNYQCYSNLSKQCLTSRKEPSPAPLDTKCTILRNSPTFIKMKKRIIKNGKEQLELKKNKIVPKTIEKIPKLHESGVISQHNNTIKSFLSQNENQANERNDTNELSLGAALSLKDSCLENSTIAELTFLPIF